MPDPSKIIVDTVTINQILNPPSERYYHSRLVYIKNVYFTGLDGDGKAISFTDLIFAPSTFGFANTPVWISAMSFNNTLKIDEIFI